MPRNCNAFAGDGRVATPNMAAAGEDKRHAENGGRPKFSSGGGHSQLSFGNYQLPSSQSNRAGLVPVKTEEGMCLHNASRLAHAHDLGKFLSLSIVSLPALRCPQLLHGSGSLKEQHWHVAPLLLATLQTSSTRKSLSASTTSSSPCC